MQTHELMWAADVLGCLPNVDALNVSVGYDVMPDYNVRDSFESVRQINLRVHAGSWSAAALLAEALGLAEVEGHESLSTVRDGRQVFRQWQGWAVEGSREAPCWVEIFGAEFVANEHGGQVAA